MYIYSTHHLPPFQNTRCSNALMATTHTSFFVFISFLGGFHLRLLKLPNSSIPYGKNEQSDLFKFRFWCISLKNDIFYNSRSHFVMQQQISVHSHIQILHQAPYRTHFTHQCYRKTLLPSPIRHDNNRLLITHFPQLQCHQQTNKYVPIIFFLKCSLYYFLCFFVFFNQNIFIFVQEKKVGFFWLCEHRVRIQDV